MKMSRYSATWLFVLLVLAGCASTEVTSGKSYVGDARIARPDRIIVYDFSATAADVSADSALAGQVAEHSTPQTAEEIEVGRKLGAEVAKELVAEIGQMGLAAARAVNQPQTQVGDLVIKGHFVSVEEGSAGKRLLIGFGSGSAELRTVVEGYQVTDGGLRQLGYRELKSGGGKLPGVILPAAVFAATANPIGLIVGGAAKVAGEATGSDTVEGAAKRTAKEIAEELKVAFKKQGWI